MMPTKLTLNTNIDKIIKGLLFTTMVSVLAASFITANAHATSIQAIDTAIKNSERPDKDLTLDVDRKPAQILGFLQVKPESQVLEVFAGPGYYTELLNNIVGKDGHVTVYEDSMWYDYSKSASDKRHVGGRLKNTTTVISDMNTLQLPKEKFDTALIILGLHDIYLESEKSLAGEKRDIKHFLSALYHSVKPGGILGVVEHEAKAGEQPNVSAELHRLDSKLITRLMVDAGFTFEASSNALTNKMDDHTQVVWTEGLRRKTDRSILRFRKNI
jgi:predicted methyltransferase